MKVRFSVDGSGVVHLEGAEAVFDKLPKEQSAFACKFVVLIALVITCKSVFFFRFGGRSAK